MSAIVIAEQRYSKLLDQFKAAFTGGEAANLARYHAFGQLFTEFCDGMSQRRYGTKTVDDLVTDLAVDNGPLSSLKDPRRFLYWAKNVYDTFLDLGELMALAAKGFSISHAKQLFSLEKALLIPVSAAMIGDDGRVVSTRELQEIIAGYDKQQSAKAVEQVLGDSPEQDAGSAAAPAASAAELKQMAGSIIQDAVSQVPDKEKKDKADKPAKADKNDGSSPPPLKTMKGLDKTATRLLSDLPNGFIVIREMGKKGFDSDKAHKNFKEQVANLRSSLASLQEPITKLIEELTEYERTESV